MLDLNQENTELFRTFILAQFAIFGFFLLFLILLYKPTVATCGIPVLMWDKVYFTIALVNALL